MSLPVPCPNCGRELDPMLGESVCGACVGRLRGLLAGVGDQVTRERATVAVRDRRGVLTTRTAIDGDVVVPGLASTLEAAVRGELRFGSVGPVSVTPTARLPLSPVAVRVRDELLATLMDNAAAIARARCDRPPARTLVDLAAWLHGQVGWLAFRDDGAGRVLAMTEALTTARAVIEHPHDDRAFRGRCDHLVDGVPCGAALYTAEAATVATCRACGAEHDVSTQRERLLVDARARLVTATQAALALQGLGISVKASTIRQWVHRGALQPRDYVRSTTSRTAVYRLGDVERLARREATARARHAARFVGSQDA